MRRVHFALPFVMTYATACAHRIAQDAHTGPDGSPAGAEPMVLDRGAARAVGVVTYPGGDRVDWKRIDVGAGPPGTLALTLRWTAARPGARLGVIVYDADGNQVARSPLRRGRRSRIAIDDASGSYLVEVFARERGDAATYELTAAFTPAPPPELPAAAFVEIPPPPDLPALPSPRDRHGTTCDAVCPMPPDINLPACQCVMPCPSPPDPRIRACLNAPPPPCPTCNPPRPILARVIDVAGQGRGAIVTLDRGTVDGVDTHWTAHLERHRSVTCAVVRVSHHAALCRLDANVELAPDQRVELMPP